MMNKTATSIVCFMSGATAATLFFLSLLIINDINNIIPVKTMLHEQHFTAATTTTKVVVVGCNKGDAVISNGFHRFGASPLKKKKKNDDDRLPLQFDGIDAIAFPRKWLPSEMPCVAPDDSNPSDTNWKSKKHTQKGLMFVKPLKVGGSSVSGAAVRINHQIAKEQNKSFRACKGRYHHASPVNDFSDRIKSESFLFSWLRDPIQRVASQFFHFQVSRAKVEPTDENFQRALWNYKKERNFSPSLQEHLDGLNFENYYVVLHYLIHTAKPFGKINETDMRAMLNQNIRQYDFFGITERMEESIVVLQMLLGLKTKDVLFLNAKTNGDFDDGGFAGKCFYIVPSYLSPGMKQFFQTDEFQKRGRWDRAMYNAMNRSLDLTIDETLGRGPFEEQLKKFRFAQRLVTKKCAPNVTLPCSSGGKRLGLDKTDCLWQDASCGNDCIDEVLRLENL